MKNIKKMEWYMRCAPKPYAPQGLFERLKQDVTLTESQKAPSIIRRWFAPAGTSVSLARVAAAVVVAVAVVLPLSYGTVKIVKYFTVFAFEAKYPEDNVTYSAGTTVGVKNSNKITNEQEAGKTVEEFCKLYKEGKANQVKPGVWVATLSNGEEFAFAGDPEFAGLPDAEKKALLKKQFDEINELRRAGKYERTFIEELEKDGAKIRLYQDRFVLSNGKVVTLTSGVGTAAKRQG